MYHGTPSNPKDIEKLKKENKSHHNKKFIMYFFFFLSLYHMICDPFFWSMGQMVHCLEGTACTPHAEKSWHSPLRKCQIPAQCRSTIVLAVKDCKEKAMSLVQQDP